MAAKVKEEEERNQQRIEEVKQTSKKYEELSSGIKEIKSKEELFEHIEKLK
jgi:hypothetical protein